MNFPRSSASGRPTGKISRRSLAPDLKHRRHPRHGRESHAPGVATAADEDVDDGRLLDHRSASVPLGTVDQPPDVWVVIKASAEKRLGKPLLRAYLLLAMFGAVIVVGSVLVARFQSSGQGSNGEVRAVWIVASLRGMPGGRRPGRRSHRPR